MGIKKSPQKPSIPPKRDQLGGKGQPTRPSSPPTAKPTPPLARKPTPPPVSRPSAAKTAGIAGAGVVGAAAVAGALGEETRAKLDNLQYKLNNLQGSMLLTDVHNEMSEVETTLSLLPTELEELRTKGYVFRSFLENKINVLAQQWSDMRDRVSFETTRRTQELERDAGTAESSLRMATSGNASQVARAESAINTFESKANAAKAAIRAMYAPLQENVNQTRAQIEEIRALLDNLNEAGFQLYPAEDPVAFCKAQYIEREDEGPEGLLYLTDERLIFERKEEVATKKVLFITTAKETVQELVFEVPIGQIDEVKASDVKKFLGRKEMLELYFAPEATLSGARLRLINATNEDWAGLIGRVKSREIDKERTQPKDEAAVEAAQAAPTKCSTCGATLTTAIVRGMREITCEYCGSVIRL